MQGELIGMAECVYCGRDAGEYDEHDKCREASERAAIMPPMQRKVVSKHFIRRRARARLATLKTLTRVAHNPDDPDMLWARQRLTDYGLPRNGAARYAVEATKRGPYRWEVVAS